MHSSVFSTYYTSLFLILLFSLRLLSQRSTRDRELRFFWITVISCFLLVLQDYAESRASVNPDLRFWRTTFSIAGYFLRSVAAAGLVMAVTRPENRTKWIWFPCLINLAFCCTAYFTDLVFSFDDQYRFYRGPLGLITFVIPILYLIAILWITFRRYGAYGRRYDRLILLCCAAFCLLSALLDSQVGGVRLHDAMLISSIFFYVFLRSYDIRRDSLTLLLSRQSLYDDFRSQRRGISAAVSMDMNGLKTINNTKGHTAGDEALRKIGECIREEADSRVRAYRTGGDEFVILFIGSDEIVVRATVDRIRDRIRQAGYSVSSGYAMREHGESPEELIRNAGVRMYEQKAKYYQEKKNDRRRERRQDRREDAAAPADRRKRFFEDSPLPAAQYRFRDHEAETLAVSDGFCLLFGYPDREQALHVLDKDTVKDIHPDDQERYSGALLRFSEGAGELDVVYRTRAGVQSGWRVIHARGSMTRTAEGDQTATVWYMDEGAYAEGQEASGSPMSQALNQALHEESILHAAHFDDLTGLPNLTWFFKLCEVVKNRAVGDGGNAVMMYIDLNGMKHFNHRYSFAEGDRLLKAFAKVLEGIFGRDNCCHVTSDHFAAATTEDRAEAQLKRLFAEARLMNDKRTLPVRVGLYSTSVENVPPTTAYDRAKYACDAALRSDVSAYHYYDAELQEASRKAQYLADNLDRAIEERWIQVYYQPIVRAVSEKICDEEALARWIDPTEGFLSPADFIPQLERSGLIYKLDLCVLDQVLEKIRGAQEHGVHVVPHSINLSRNDFDACDIVEEVRRRVDDSGIPRDRITIEITESVAGQDMEFMKEQIGRFRALGFQVWMDDFGSGYSSLDVLQTIPFDLIKFDMSFTRKLDEGENSRIILTELMKMATSIGVDTVCEGIETEAQKRFLQEIGCSKLQGYYFSKPLSLDQIRQRYAEGLKIGFEDPKASGYYETVGRVDLYDVSSVLPTEEHSFRRAFNTLPTAVIEVLDGKVRYVRSTPSYREFVNRFFGFNQPELSAEFREYKAPFMKHVAATCSAQGNRSFFNERMPDGSVVHSFARMVAENPVNGARAVTVMVLSISDPAAEEPQKTPEA